MRTFKRITQENGQAVFVANDGRVYEVLIYTADRCADGDVVSGPEQSGAEEHLAVEPEPAAELDEVLDEDGDDTEGLDEDGEDTEDPDGGAP